MKLPISEVSVLIALLLKKYFEVVMKFPIGTENLGGKFFEVSSSTFKGLNIENIGGKFC